MEYYVIYVYPAPAFHGIGFVKLFDGDFLVFEATEDDLDLVIWIFDAFDVALDRVLSSIAPADGDLGLAILY